MPAEAGFDPMGRKQQGEQVCNKKKMQKMEGFETPFWGIFKGAGASESIHANEMAILCAHTGNDVLAMSRMSWPCRVEGCGREGRGSRVASRARSPERGFGTQSGEEGQMGCWGTPTLIDFRSRLPWQLPLSRRMTERMHHPWRCVCPIPS